jgi:hypothetical protein
VKWVTEEEKWEMRRVCTEFIFNYRSHGCLAIARQAVANRRHRAHTERTAVHGHHRDPRPRRFPYVD